MESVLSKYGILRQRSGAGRISGAGFGPPSNMSSKLSFRARALDATKALAIYHAEDIPDLADFAAINRTVPQMPTGMEKEEENASSVLSAILFYKMAANFIYNLMK